LFIYFSKHSKRRHDLNERENFIQNSSSQCALQNFIKAEEKMHLNVFSCVLPFPFVLILLFFHIKSHKNGTVSLNLYYLRKEDFKSPGTMGISNQISTQE
jgi:hypothetical protein